MSSISIIRLAIRASQPTIAKNATYSFQRLSQPSRLSVTIPTACTSSNSFSTTRRTLSDEHGEESFEEFSARYEKEFEGVQDVFELQRNLNNAFAYDLVPSPSVITAALHAARRVNDYPTAVRIFEGIKSKVENKGQYEEYLTELKDLRESLGVNLKEDLYPEAS